MYRYTRLNVHISGRTTTNLPSLSNNRKTHDFFVLNKLYQDRFYTGTLVSYGTGYRIIQFGMC